MDIDEIKHKIKNIKNDPLGKSDLTFIKSFLENDFNDYIFQELKTKWDTNVQINSITISNNNFIVTYKLNNYKIVIDKKSLKSKIDPNDFSSEEMVKYFLEDLRNYYDNITKYIFEE